MVQHGNGQKSRKNKILLAYIKNKDLLHQARINNDYELLHIDSMSELKQVMTRKIQESGLNNKYSVRLINTNFRSNIYQTDDCLGLGEDGDPKDVRYRNMNSNKVSKMKAGKFLRALILETEFGKTLPEQILGYLCEEFTQEWEGYTMSTLPKNKLVVSKEFAKIYSSASCNGDFKSCMVNKGHHYFYENAVDVSAAYLTGENGKIIARCIIYNKCYDEDGKAWRLAERQYSSNGNDTFKRALIDKLIAAKEIDGYKKVGAGCCDSREFVDVHGNSLSNKEFMIECNLDTYETLSYQDSFKYYDYDKGEAYNFEPDHYDYDLGTTDVNLDGDTDDDENYDSFHDNYTDNDVVTVRYHGEQYTCDEYDLDEFVWSDVEDMYIHKDDVEYCPECDGAYDEDKGIYSDITDEYYCCSECKKDAEKKFKEEHWYWSEIDHEYYQTEDEVTEILKWDKASKQYKVFTISRESLLKLVEEKKCYLFEGTYYDRINKRTGLPFYYKRRKVAA